METIDISTTERASYGQEIVSFCEALINDSNAKKVQDGDEAYRRSSQVASIVNKDILLSATRYKSSGGSGTCFQLGLICGGVEAYFSWNEDVSNLTPDVFTEEILQYYRTQYPEITGILEH